jgi:predicted negative regulator of RcsB-dependent stress response
MGRSENAISESLKLLQSNQSSDTTKILAQTLDIQGRLQLSLGQAEPALETWQQAVKSTIK